MATTSIKEVARHAGVSVGTVSNVLNRPHLVAAATLIRVQNAIAELGFVRNESARALRAGRSRTIALVVLDVANPFFTDVARGAQEVAEESGAFVVVCNSVQDVAREHRHLAMLEELRVLGLLITPVADSTEKLLDQLVERGMPVVLVDSRAVAAERCSVAVDDVLGGRLAGLHLVEQGHQRIAFVGGPFSIRQVSDRHRGFTEALSDGAVEGAVVPTDSLTVAAGRTAVERLAGLPVRRRPTGIFCANDLLALGVLQEVIRRGLRVPEDFAIVGYDDIEYAAAAAIPLSSVSQPRDLLGRTAAQLLLDEVREGAGHEHRHVDFDPELVVRDSSLWHRGRPALARGTEAHESDVPAVAARA